jgi:hypothetical protein
LMAAEYELDALSAHVHQKGCDCVKPLALRHLRNALDAVRSARDTLRIRTGNRQWTLFAGNSPGQPNATKPWRGRTHGRKWDCPALGRPKA